MVVGIVAPAVDIDQRTLVRFRHWLAASRPATNYRVHLEQSKDQQGFSISKAKNRGILALLDTCETIVCTDIDMLIPPGLVDHTAAVVRRGRALWAVCRNIDASEAEPPRWQDWLSRPLRRQGQGSWVAMTVADWFRTGGWDERLEGWGGDDVILAERRIICGIETITTRDYPLMHVNHPPRDGDWALHAVGNHDNLAIGRTPTPRNFLAGRRPIDRHNHHVTLIVNAQCQRRCPQCSQRSLMHRDPDYAMTLEEVDRFIECTQRSNYPKFNSLIISGGEPLLWPHLEAAATRLRQAGIAHQVNIFTNGLAYQRLTPATVEAVSVLRISRYRENEAAIAWLQRRWPEKVLIVDRREHFTIPPGLLGAETLPADCCCEGWGVYRGTVYGCPQIPTLTGEFDHADLNPAEVSCSLQEGYLEILSRWPRLEHPYCRGCVANRKVRLG